MYPGEHVSRCSVSDRADVEMCGVTPGVLLVPPAVQGAGRTVGQTNKKTDVLYLSQK